MKPELKTQETESYYEFISNIYRYDDDNVIHYEKVEGLMDAMFEVYDNECNEKHYFLYKNIVKEINKVLRKLEKK